MLFFKKFSSQLRKDGIVLIRTDTVPGFIGDAFSLLARKNIYSLKKRITQKKLACAFKNIEQIKKYTLLNQKEEQIIEKYLPGKLTIILKVKKKYCFYFGKTIAVRIPNCPFFLKLLSFYNRPVVLTSSNISGEKEITNTKLIAKKFSNKNLNFFLLDKNFTFKVIPSSIVQVINGEVKFIRYGKIKKIEPVETCF